MSGRGKRGGGDYEVGHGRPPKHTRYKPLQSGNPNGRPKGAKGKHKELLAWLEPTREMLLEEAYAPFKLPSGEVIPMIRVVARATIKAAATGGMLAQRTMLQAISDAEAHAAQVHLGLFETARKYRDECEAEQRRCAAAGIPEPDFVPHPEDIHLDWETLQVKFSGPITREGKDALDKLLEERDKNEKAFFRFRAEAITKPRDWTLLGLAMMVQDKFDAISEALPERCRKRLKNRMTAEERQRAIARIKAAKPRARGRKPKSTGQQTR